MLLDRIDLEAMESLSPDRLRLELRNMVETLLREENVVVNELERRNLVRDIQYEMLGLGPLEPLLAEIGADGYAALTLDGRDRPLVALRVATAAPLSAEQIERIALAADLPEAQSLNYQDRSHGILKRARIEGSRLNGILLAGEDAASGWLRAALRDGIAIDDLRRWIFAPRATPPIATAAPRRVVCNCFDVSADAIEAEIKSGQTLPAIQEKLKCGTSCGSCLTELRRMLGQ